jgi:hypothetical protein
VLECAGENCLATEVVIETTVTIPFGLGLLAAINVVKEGLMNNSIVSSCVRVGAAFLRG